VTLHEGIVDIGNSAFQSSGITSMKVPDSVTTIGASAFASCLNLTSVTLSKSITAIPYSCFGDCLALTSVTLYEGITDLGNSAFAGCDLKSLEMPNSVTTIGTYLAARCFNLVSVTLSQNVTAIPDFCFMNCTALTSISLHENITTIGNSSFSGCGLKSIKIPDSVKSINGGLFALCVSLASVTLSVNITAIPDLCFSGCLALESISLHEGITKIECQAFVGSGLKNVKIPNSVKVIEGSAFFGCHSLATVTFGTTIVIDTFGDGAFKDSGLQDIALPNSVTWIQNQTFVNCKKLKSISLGPNIEDFVNDSLIGAESLKEMVYTGHPRDPGVICPPLIVAGLVDQVDILPAQFREVCGPRPSPTHSGKRSKKGLIIGVSIGSVAAAAGLVLAIIFFVKWRRGRSEPPDGQSVPSLFQTLE
jgi:hypothetical protein